jgi:hypothetical protein
LLELFVEPGRRQPGQRPDGDLLAEAGHGLDSKAYDDRIAWLASLLGVPSGG